jgi:hypothetical protein
MAAVSPTPVTPSSRRRADGGATARRQGTELQAPAAARAGTSQAKQCEPAEHPDDNQAEQTKTMNRDPGACAGAKPAGHRLPAEFWSGTSPTQSSDAGHSA